MKEHKVKPINWEDRKWLNKKGQGRSTVVFNYDGWSLGGDVIIADCHRQINLDFSVYLGPRQGDAKVRKEVNEKIAKAQVMIDQLKMLQDAMLGAYEQYRDVDAPAQAAEDKKARKTIRTTSLEELLKGN